MTRLTHWISKLFGRVVRNARGLDGSGRLETDEGVSSDDAPRVAVENLSKSFDGTPALEDVDLSVAAGEFCVLLGPSGCGKSTLLRIVAGLETPTAGRVFINERDVTDRPPGARDVAMVFQNYAVYPHMTVRENLAFPLRMRKAPKDEIDRRVREAAAMLGLENLLERRPSQLSGGQRQRTAIGRAIVRRPSVFLFDEPLSNLDARLRTGMRMEIARLHNRLGATSVYVTHDQIEAMTLADRIVILDEGRVRQIGAPHEIYTKPADLMVAGFVGSPEMNFIEGSAARTETAGVNRFRGQGVELDIPSDAEGEVTIGIRPEHLSIASEGPLSGRTVFVEDMGSQRFAHVRVSESVTLTVRTEPAERPARDEAVTIAVDIDNVHIFRNGANILVQ